MPDRVLGTVEIAATNAAARGGLGTAPRRDAAIDLLRGYSVEIGPHEKVDIARCAEMLGPGRAVYITAVPGLRYEESIRFATRLRAAGLRPVLHLAARRIASADALQDFLARATGEAGVDDLLVIAGDQDRPLGPYQDSEDILESGLLQRHGIRRVAIAGYPGGHPKIPAERLHEVLLRKLTIFPWAGLEGRIVTQFCFEPERIVDWCLEARRRGVTLPIHVGLAGLANVRTLLRFAKRCGVAASLGMLKSRGRQLVDLLAVSAPDEILAALAAARAARPELGSLSIHFFPFGALEPTVRWAEAVLRGEFDLRAEVTGLDVRGV